MTGSTLFSTLLSQLKLVQSYIIRFDDDAYFFIEGDNKEQTSIAAEKTVPKRVDWPKLSGTF